MKHTKKLAITLVIGAALAVTGATVAQAHDTQSAPTAPQMSSADRVTGTVAYFDDRQGFGFLSTDNDGPPAYVHHSAIEGNVQLLEEGQKVEYELVKGDSRYEAAHVRVIKKAKSDD